MGTWHDFIWELGRFSLRNLPNNHSAIWRDFTHFTTFAKKYPNMENEDIEQPHIVSSHDIHIDTEYANWIAEVKHRYRSAQVKAAVRVNAEKLLFNWQLGRDLVQKKAEERWGAGVVEQVSLDLQNEFPDSTNFSTRNLWYMKQWYLFYTDESGKLKQPVSELLPEGNYKKTPAIWRRMVRRGKTETSCFRISLDFCMCPLGTSCANRATFKIHRRSAVLCWLYYRRRYKS